MLKKIFLIRHAEASITTVGLKDFDRPLTASGFRDAAHIGKYLFKKNITPETFLSSTALRTKQTSEEIATQIKYESRKITFQDKLYEPSVRELLEQINEIDKGNTALLVTHNPSVTYLVEYLTNEPIGNMEPGTVVEINFAVDSWAGVSQNTGEMTNRYTPN